MIKTYNIINSLNTEEIRGLKILLLRTNKTEDRKDVKLLDYVRKNKNKINEDCIMQQLYPDSDKNSFYRLKNRLQNEINKSLIFSHHNDSDYNLTLHYISISNIFNNKEDYSLALDYLLAAEKKALKSEIYNLLDLIYTKIIELLIESVKFDPKNYIKKKEKNLTILTKVNEADSILATLSYKVKISQNYNATQLTERKILLKQIKKISEDKVLKSSLNLQLKIYHVISRLLLQDHDYTQLEGYLKVTFKHFVDNSLFTKANHDSKLQMLTYLANCLFKNDKIDESFIVAKRLYVAMGEYNKFLYNKYLIYYYNTLVINYQVKDKLKAITILEEAENKKELQNIPVFSLFVYLNLSILFFNLNELKKSRKNLIKLKLQDNYTTTDKNLRFKIGILELIIIFEQQDFKLFNVLLKSLKSEFNGIVNENHNSRDNKFLELLIKMVDSPQKEINKLIRNYKKSYKTTSDSDIINYNNWLSKKAENIK